MDNVDFPNFEDPKSDHLPPLYNKLFNGSTAPFSVPNTPKVFLPR